MKYEPALNGLRAVAVVMVVLFHAFPDQFPGGWVGVDIFFVLSGFLITSILATEFEKHGKLSFSNFYWRRAVRLMPAALALMAVQLIRAVFSPHWKDILLSTSAAAFYFMNINLMFRWFPEDLIGHTWSLSIEEQFYWVWPLILSFLIFRRQTISWLFLLLIAITAWRIWLGFHGASIERLYFGTDTHTDGLVVGALLAFAPDWLRARLATLAWPALAVLAGILLSRHNNPVMFAFELIASAICGAVLVCGALCKGWFGSALRMQPIVFTGIVSYGWYLWHAPLILGAQNHGAHGITMIAVICTTYAAAVGSWYLIERPARRFAARRWTLSKQTHVLIPPT